MNVRTLLTSGTILALLVGMYCVYVVLTFRTFGITWDETDVYTSGRMTWSHLATRKAPDEPLLMSKTPGSEIRAVYNSAYAAVLYKFNKHESYERYHAFNMIFNGLALVASYVLLFVYYKNPWIALVGPIFLVLTPRYFGDFPANPKDVPFATMYFVGLVGIYLSSFVKNSYVRIVLLAVLFGVVQSLRIVGVTLFPLLFAYEVYRFLEGSKLHFSLAEIARWLVDHVLWIGITLFCALFITALGWPYLGSSFLKHLVDVLETSKAYPWFGSTLTNGVYMKSNELSWRYMAYWYAYTTPIFILVLSVVALVKGFLTNFRNPLYFILSLALFLNVSMILLSNPNMYDGLRHTMFLLPILSMLAAVFFVDILVQNGGVFRAVVVACVVVNAVFVVQTYHKIFPYTYVYFNEFAGGLKGASGKFETDYWGASFREAVVWLREETKNNNKNISVHTCAHPFISQYYFGSHMTWTSNTHEADYSICYTRQNEHRGIVGKVVHVVERDGVGLNYVKKNETKR